MSCSQPTLLLLSIDAGIRIHDNRTVTVASRRRSSAKLSAASLCVTVNLGSHRSIVAGSVHVIATVGDAAAFDLRAVREIVAILVDTDVGTVGLLILLVCQRAHVLGRDERFLLELCALYIIWQANHRLILAMVVPLLDGRSASVIRVHLIRLYLPLPSSILNLISMHHERVFGVLLADRVEVTGSSLIAHA